MDGGTAWQNPFEYNPATNTWTTKAATFSDNQVSNLQGGVITMGGTPVILAVGGSAGGGTGGTTEVRTYNHVTDALTVLSSDPWTPGTSDVPGGSAVWNNKVYIIGGYDITNAVAKDYIWEFDPARAAGSRWVQKTATLPTALAYVPAATIGNFIYTAGGEDTTSGSLEDSNLAFRYDPTADTISAIATLPNVTGETRAVNFRGELWVLGGGRITPNPSNAVQVYNPGTGSWSSGPAFNLARRNFPADTDGTDRVWLAGGYAPTSPPTDTMEIYNAGVVCGTPTPVVTVPVATNTATSTGTTGPTNTPAITPAITPSVTATACVMSFTDVNPGDWFYEYVEYLYCHGVVNGYNTTPPCDTGTPCFKPGNTTTRGQLTKIVVLGFNFPIDTTGGPHFSDVVPGSTFYDYVETLYNIGAISGYTDGTFRPDNWVTRGQITKIIVLSAIYADPANWQLLSPPTNYFEDVPVGSVYFDYIETAFAHDVITGYPCGTPPAGPCVPPNNKHYFLPYSYATRAQISKVAYLTITYTPPR
jgi:hypothetical protein